MLLPPGPRRPQGNPVGSLCFVRSGPGTKTQEQVGKGIPGSASRGYVVVGETQALELHLCLNLRQQGVKGFAHSQIWAQFPTLTPAQAAQSLVGTWANDQITLFCTKCYRAKGKSNWLCAGDRDKGWGTFHRGGCCWKVHRVEKGAQASWGSRNTSPHPRCT